MPLSSTTPPTSRAGIPDARIRATRSRLLPLQLASPSRSAVSASVVPEKGRNLSFCTVSNIRWIRSRAPPSLPFTCFVSAMISALSDCTASSGARYFASPLACSFGTSMSGPSSNRWPSSRTTAVYPSFVPSLTSVPIQLPTRLSCSFDSENRKAADEAGVSVITF